MSYISRFGNSDGVLRSTSTAITIFSFCEYGCMKIRSIFSLSNSAHVSLHWIYRPKKADTATAGEMDFTYYSATATVMNALSKVKDEKGMKRVEKFLKEDVCPECHGTRLSEEARAP